MLVPHISVIVALACFLHYPGPNLPMAVFFTFAAIFHSALIIVCFANLSARRRYYTYVCMNVGDEKFGARLRETIIPVKSIQKRC